MSVLGFLTETASKAVLSAAEQVSINTSITALESRLNQHFNSGQIKAKFRFGSSTRGTILPRSMDEESDIDYMIVFSDGGLSPQTYLNRLKTFVQTRYGASTVYQSSPTIVLELNHIKFDLVPATTGWFGGLQIPNSTSGWRDTDPNNFNAVLENKNKANNALIKPTIRLMKYWNAASGNPFESFEMEQWICDLNFWGCVNQKDYLFAIIDKLSTSIWQTQKVNGEIQRAKDIVAKTRQYERNAAAGLAELQLRRLFRL